MKIKTLYPNQNHFNSRGNQQIANANKENNQRSYKYELVGTMIKIMLIINGQEVACVKSIPIQAASPGIIAKLENLTIADMMMINDLKNEKELDKEEAKNLPKEHIEYEKHLVYETP